MSRHPEQRERARQLRRDLAPAEAVLWNKLRDRRLAGFKFRRQVPMGPYFADFACVEFKVVIEVDGDLHVGRERYDEKRTAYLAADGWLVLRFWNPQVYEEMDEVLLVIMKACEDRKARASGDG